MERLKKLGIGGKPGERRLHSREEAIRTNSLSSIRGGETPTREAPDTVPNTMPVAAPEAEMRSRFPIPGTQAQAGLFTKGGTADAVFNVVKDDMTNSDPNMRGGFEGTGELTDGTTIYTGEERQSNGFNPVTTGIDLLQGSMQRGDIRAGAAELGKTGEFAEGTTINTTGVDLSQDPIKNAINTLVQTVTEKAQSAKDFAEQQKQAYLDNRNKRMQQRASTTLMDMEYQLMQKIMERDQLQKDSFELINLEKQVGEANNQMDQTNLVLRNSGLFGQGMGGPSYSNPMQPVMPGQQPFDPGLSINSMYENPEYYEAGVALSNEVSNPNSPMYDAEYANRPVEYYDQREQPEPYYTREFKRLYE